MIIKIFLIIKNIQSGLSKIGLISQTFIKKSILMNKRILNNIYFKNKIE